MSTQNDPLFEAILARLSFGAVPVDGILWLDPRYLERRKATAQARRSGGTSATNGTASTSRDVSNPCPDIGHPEGAR